MAELLCEQYSSVFSPAKYTDEEITQLLADDSLESELGDVLFNKLDIIEAIESISSNSAPVQTASRLCCSSNAVTHSPSQCKTGNIVPIHKGGSRGSAKHYLPVALTSHSITVFEKVVKKALIRFIEDNGLLFQPQPAWIQSW